MRAFDDISGQERVCSYLQRALDSGRTTHAYLLVGGSAQERVGIAERFAAALVAAGDVDAFADALRGAHPDMRRFEPQGAGAYLVEQARQLVHDAELAPVRSARKAYVINQADRLAGAPANALLKTLEEPPEDVVCILLAASEQGVLETIRSRCEVLVCHERLAEQPADEEVFNILYATLTGADNRYVLNAADRLVELSRAGSADLELRQAEELEAGKDYLSQGARKSIEQRHKRELSALQRNALLDQITAMRSWLRDCLLVSQGAGQLAAHENWRAQTAQLAGTLSASELLAALESAQKAQARITGNVTPQLAMEALLFEIREATCR